MSAFAPPGWPSEVAPPHTEGWEASAQRWLLDVVPPEYRGYPALRHHLVLLVRFSVIHVEACQAAVRRGVSQARADLRNVAERSAVDAAVQTWLLEDARLQRVRREVGLVEDAVRGRRFVARFGD